MLALEGSLGGVPMQRSVLSTACEVPWGSGCMHGWEAGVCRPVNFLHLAIRQESVLRSHMLATAGLPPHAAAAGLPGAAFFLAASGLLLTLAPGFAWAACR
jgi:hypothetical protein